LDFFNAFALKRYNSDVMFEDRVKAAEKLCLKLPKFTDKKNTFVVGLTRGGVVTAKVISDYLNLKLKALIIKKIGVPWNEELAIGAMTSANDVFWNESLCKELAVSKVQKRNLVLEKEKELKKLANLLKLQTKEDEFNKKNIILVDDGVATGISAITAAKTLRKNGAKTVILATPVIASDTLTSIKKYFDKVIFIKQSQDFYSVSQFYNNFEQISDKKVAKILKS